MPSGTSLRRCTCKSDYQDKRYGLQVRVFNGMTKFEKSRGPQWRCTSCGREKEQSGS